MKKLKLLTTIAITSVVIFAGCTKSNNDPATSTTNPVIIPLLYIN